MNTVNQDIADLFMNIETVSETDTRYDKMTVSRCRKGLEYLEYDTRDVVSPDVPNTAEHNTHKSVTIRYWIFTRIQWWTFIRILDKISDKLTDLKIIGCNIDNKRFKDIMIVLKKYNLIKLLDLSENHITQLSSIEYLTNLQELSLAFNDKIEDITSLSKLCKLKSLNLRVNLIQYLEPLSNLKELCKLDLSINQIVDISPLWKLKELKELSLYANYKLQFIGQLSGLTQLTIINISQCDIRSLKYIERLQKNLPQCQIIYDKN